MADDTTRRMEEMNRRMEEMEVSEGALSAGGDEMENDVGAAPVHHAQSVHVVGQGEPPMMPAPVFSFAAPQQSPVHYVQQAHHTQQQAHMPVVHYVQQAHMPIVHYMHQGYVQQAPVAINAVAPFALQAPATFNFTPVTRETLLPTLTKMLKVARGNVAQRIQVKAIRDRVQEIVGNDGARAGSLSAKRSKVLDLRNQFEELVAVFSGSHSINIQELYTMGAERLYSVAVAVFPSANPIQSFAEYRAECEILLGKIMDAELEVAALYAELDELCGKANALRL